MDWKSLIPMITGALGAAGGSFIPGLGTALGGMAGSALGGLGVGLFGGGDENNQRSNMPQYAPQSFGGINKIGMPGGSSMYQMPNFRPQQQNALDQMLQQALMGMQNLPTANFGDVKKMYEQNFQQQTVPGIAERFSSLGAGSQRSSAFEQALGTAGAGMNTQLAGMQQMFNQQQRGDEVNRLMQMLQLGVAPQYQYMQEPAQTSSMQTLMGTLGPSLIKAAGKYGIPGLQNWWNQSGTQIAAAK